uniref:Interleukin 1 receptor associated kinase 3 n=1 Tax=Callorhinchus milii TaxID=7868 RepID=A0A4W3I5T5_CALMI
MKPSFSASTPILDVAPSLMEKLCQIMDSHDGSLGWRGLAERISTDWLEFRTIERFAEQGKSRTGELLWMWGLKNKTVGDLLQLLHDMDQQRAIHLFVQKGKIAAFYFTNDPISPIKRHVELSLKPHLPIKVHTICETKLTIQMNRSLHLLVYVKPRSLFTYEDIALATRKFHHDFKIGEGAFSEVYKTVIQNKIFAVKLDISELSFLNSIPRFHHPNILELAGYCSENDKYCLAYNYMKNGSLLDRLNCLGHTAPLAWSIRLQIITGLARAIQYLHTAQPCTVICGNITSANVLLDEELQPKLSDFGLACLRPHSVNQNHTISMDVRTSRIIGYLPEEYLRHGKLSTKVDVYSFGVVSLNLCK